MKRDEIGLLTAVTVTVTNILLNLFGYLHLIDVDLCGIYLYIYIYICAVADSFFLLSYLSHSEPSLFRRRKKLIYAKKKYSSNNSIDFFHSQNTKKLVHDDVNAMPRLGNGYTTTVVGLKRLQTVVVTNTSGKLHGEKNNDLFLNQRCSERRTIDLGKIISKFNSKLSKSNNKLNNRRQKLHAMTITLEATNVLHQQTIVKATTGVASHGKNTAENLSASQLRKGAVGVGGGQTTVDEKVGWKDISPRHHHSVAQEERQAIGEDVRKLNPRTAPKSNRANVDILLSPAKEEANCVLVLVPEVRKNKQQRTHLKKFVIKRSHLENFLCYKTLFDCIYLRLTQKINASLF